MDEEIRVCSLFSEIGGIDLGLSKPALKLFGLMKLINQLAKHIKQTLVMDI